MLINRLTELDLSKLVDETLVEIIPAKVSLLVRGRNAWHSVWVEHYISRAAIYSNLDSAKHGAERLRERGNVFEVIETPALVLSGNRHAVVVVDANANQPFSAFSGFGSHEISMSTSAYVDGIFHGSSLADAVGVFEREDHYWSTSTSSSHLLLLGLMDASDSVEELSGNLTSFKSKAQGVNYYLAWETRENLKISDATVALARTWRDLSEPNGDYVSRRVWLRNAESKLIDADRALKEATRASKHQGIKVQKHRSNLAKAELAFRDAQINRLNTANTSAGMAKQRVRLEKARSKFEELKAMSDILEDEWDRLADEEAQLDLARSAINREIAKVRFGNLFLK